MTSNDLDDELETNGAISLTGYKKSGHNPSSEEDFCYDHFD